MHQWSQNIGELLKFPSRRLHLSPCITQQKCNLQLFESFLFFHQTRVDTH